MAKYDFAGSDARADAVLRTELDVLEGALAGRRYLVGDAFSYADIAMALTLQQVSPVDPRYIERLSGLGPEGTNVGDLEERYTGLIAWHDALNARHRRPHSSV